MPIFPDLDVAPAIPTPSLIAKQEKMKVKEKPLILMDATLIYYQRNWDAGDLLQLKNECKKHGGEWVTIVHNDLVKHPALKGLEELFYG